MTRISHLIVLALCSFLVSCGSFQKNPQLEKYNANSGYRFDQLKKGNNNSDELFVVLTFSGGGTRAAALSYGVLQQLNQTKITWEGKTRKLLDEVDIISSVSGGSFTAAYYTLNRDAIFDGRYESVFLKKDIQGALKSALFNPGNWFKLAGGSYGRSDLAADYYNENIFNGATFNMLTKQAERPFLMLNATDMTTGRQFPFIQDQFDILCSDLDGVSIARAVATSSAFPGLLTPLTYENYMNYSEVRDGKNSFFGTCRYEEPRWVSLAIKGREIAPERANIAQDRRTYYKKDDWGVERRYIHLVDGGVADNLGLRSLIFALETSDPSFDIQSKINNKEIKKLVVIAVNAATDPEQSRDDSPDVPGVIDVLTTASTVPLDNFTFDTLMRTDSAVSAYTEDVKIRKACEKVLSSKCPGAKLKGNLYELELFLVDVSFDGIKDAKTRHEFKNLPTSFKLTAEQVDKLQAMGGKLLRDNKEFKEFMKGM